MFAVRIPFDIFKAYGTSEGYSVTAADVMGTFEQEVLGMFHEFYVTLNPSPHLGKYSKLSNQYCTNNQ
jgi:hypothetical protein